MLNGVDPAVALRGRGVRERGGGAGGRAQSWREPEQRCCAVGPAWRLAESRVADRGRRARLGSGRGNVEVSCVRWCAWALEVWRVNRAHALQPGGLGDRKEPQLGSDFQGVMMEKA